MRNLKLDVLNIESLQLQNVLRIISINNTQRFILDGKTVHHIQNESEQIAEGILSIDWVPIENMIYMGDGEKFNCYNIHTRENSIIEVPYSYVAYQWNPSQDKIALVDKNGFLKIVVLDAYNSVCIVNSEYELAIIEKSSFIDIGWGTRETQFKGSEGKFVKSADQSSEEIVDNAITIAWREEGDMLAVSFVREQKRIFKIISSECEFLFECEYKPGLGAQIAWKPDGSLLAVENISALGQKLLFFEKNGLYRFDLKLPSDAPVRKIAWDSLGDILMVWQQNNVNSEISLLIYSNCKWYLKQSLVFNNKENNVNYVRWCNKKNLEVYSSKYLLKYAFKWIVHASNSNNYDVYENNNNIGAVAVIDGNNLRVSVTRSVIIPPPLSSYIIELEKPINHIAFGVNTNTVVVVLNDNTFKIFELDADAYTEKFCNTLVSKFALSLNHFVYDDTNSALYCAELDGKSDCIINKYHIDLTTSKYIAKKCNAGECSATNVLDLIRVFEPLKHGFHLGICIENNLQVCSDSNVTHPNRFELDQDDFISMEDNVDNSGLTSIVYAINKYNAFSLKNHRFYYNSKRVHNNVTSYIFCHGYLLLTTTDNNLICVKLTNKSLRHLENRRFNQFHTRSLPSGAILMTAVPGTRKIILQVPRGELEIINPRVLTINEIDRLLGMKKHLAAYLIMRADRINPNLLYDINPKRFLHNAEGFITDINNCDYIDVFLTNLQNSNITEQLYNQCFEEHLPEQSYQDKISIVTDELIKTMTSLNWNYYLQSILTAYQCKGTDDGLKEALVELNKARHSEIAGTKFRVPVDDTLKYLLQLVPVEKLYETALNLDNIELTIWIVSKSQKDPSEYMPFLQEIRQLETNYRNYKINIHTKNYTQAFRFLIQCDNVLEELKLFVEKQSLHHLILQYVDKSNQWYNPLLVLYAEHLNVKNRYKESGIIYTNLGISSYKKALQSFCEGGHMKEALTILNALNTNEVEINKMLTNLARKLTENKSYQDAAYVYDIVLKDYENAVLVLIKGHCWSDAYYLASKNNRADLIETEVKPDVSNYCDVLIKVFKDAEHEFIKMLARLQKLRTDRISQLERGAEDEDNRAEGPESAIQNIDLESVVSTNYSQTSLRSKSSHKSSTSSRKQKRIDRKLMSLKEGSAFENIAITRQLYITITNTQNLMQRVSETCSFLFMMPEFTIKGFALQLVYDKLILLMKGSAELIWVPEIINVPNTVTVESQAYRYNLEYLDLEYRQPPQNIGRGWKKLFI